MVGDPYLSECKFRALMPPPRVGGDAGAEGGPVRLRGLCTGSGAPASSARLFRSLRGRSADNSLENCWSHSAFLAFLLISPLVPDALRRSQAVLVGQVRVV